MGADIETGQPHQGHGGQGEGAALRAEPGQGGGAQGDGDGRVPGQVPEPGGFPAAAADPGQQSTGLGRRTTCLTSFAAAQAPVPPRRSRPASSPSPARQAAAAAAGRAPNAPSCMTAQAGGYSASGRPLTAREGPGLPGAHAVAVHGGGGGQQRGEARAEPGPGIGQPLTKLDRADPSRCCPAANRR